MDDFWLEVFSTANSPITFISKLYIFFLAFESFVLNRDWFHSKIVQGKIANKNGQSSYINFLEILQNTWRVYTNTKKYLQLRSWNWALWSTIQACYHRKENRIGEEFLFHNSYQLNPINFRVLWGFPYSFQGRWEFSIICDSLFPHKKGISSTVTVCNSLIIIMNCIYVSYAFVLLGVFRISIGNLRVIELHVQGHSWKPLTSISNI